MLRHPHMNLGVPREPTPILHLKNKLSFCRLFPDFQPLIYYGAVWLKEQIELLRNQLYVKNEMIKAQSQQVTELIKSHQNSQFLLQEKDQELQEVNLLKQKERSVEDHDPEATETS
jgi:hypothetical protein